MKATLKLNHLDTVEAFERFPIVFHFNCIRPFPAFRAQVEFTCRICPKIEQKGAIQTANVLSYLR